MSYGEGSGPTVIPFYAICDVSAAMFPHLGDLNNFLRQMMSEFLVHPIVSDLALLSIITFNDTARTEVPLGPLADVSVPTFRVGGGASYGAAFREFHRAFEEDRRRLREEGCRVYRPVVYFLTAGKPSDLDYHNVFATLFDRDVNPAFPNVVPFGFADASVEMMESLAYSGSKLGGRKWGIASLGHTFSDLYSSLIASATQSIANSRHDYTK